MFYLQLKLIVLSYFYKKFKQYFNFKPSKVISSLDSIMEINIKYRNHLCCDIRRYHYYCKYLHQNIAHLLSHKDFEDITIYEINPSRIYDALYVYTILEFNTKYKNLGWRLKTKANKL